MSAHLKNYRLAQKSGIVDGRYSHEAGSNSIERIETGSLAEASPILSPYGSTEIATTVWPGIRLKA